MLRLGQYEFGGFRLDSTERALFRQGQLVPLTPKSLETLLFLVERRGHIVEKDDLMKAVWPDTFVEEASLARNISVLRKVLSEGEEGREFIETIPKRGYRFVAPVQELATDATGGPAAGATEQVVPAPASPRTWIVWTVTAALLATAVIGYTAWRRAGLPNTVAASRVMLAVLPVQNLTGDPSREYISDGLTEEIIAQLGEMNSARLGVIARTSSMAYKQTTKTAGQIGRELGADYILETSVRESGGQVRFTAQLVRSADQTHVWAHSYERAMKDIIALQAEMARTVADRIRVELTPGAEARLSSPHSVNPEAYDAFIQARYRWNGRSPASLRSAIELYQRSLAEDSSFAASWAGLADSYALLATMGEVAPKETMPKAKDALLKALSLDDSLAQAHTSLGWVLDIFDWDWAGSEREFRRAIELDSSDAVAHHRYAVHLAAMGRFPESLGEMREAARLDPLSPNAMAGIGWVYLRARQPDRALAECQKALDLDPQFARGYMCRGQVYEQKGDFDRAAAEFLQARIVAEESAEIVDALKSAVAQSGYKGYFRTRLAQLTAKSRQTYVSPYDFADTYDRLGENAKVLKWLEASFLDRSPCLANLQIEWRLDPVRSDPHFQDLLGRVGLAQIRILPLTE